MTPHRGAMVLILGILSYFTCPLLGIVAWVMGRADLTEINAGRMDPAGRDLTQIGMVLGIVSTALLVLSLCVGVAWLTFFLSLVAAGHAS